MFFTRVLISMLAIMIISYLFPSIIWVEGIMPALAASFILGIVNAVVRPVLIVLTLPLTVFSFGLFLLVVNGLMLSIVTFFVPGFHVSGLFGGITGAVLISIVSWVLSTTLSSK